MKNTIIGLFLISLLFFGCIGSGTAPTTQPNNTNTTVPVIVQPAAAPSFTITTPVSGAKIETPKTTADVILTLDISNLIIKPKGNQVKDGEGHFILTLDSSTNPTETFSKTTTLSSVSVGAHTLKVELVKNDGSSYSPEISKYAQFTVVQKIVTYQPKTHEIVINDFTFVPATITVNVTDSITWVNKGKYPRSATSNIQDQNAEYLLPSFDTGMISPGANATVKITTAGTYNYQSINYPSMTGKITAMNTGTSG